MKQKKRFLGLIAVALLTTNAWAQTMTFTYAGGATATASEMADGAWLMQLPAGTDLNAAEMNTIVGYVYDMLYGNSGGYPSYASAAAIILFAIVLTITTINLLVSRKHVHY